MKQNTNEQSVGRKTMGNTTPPRRSAIWARRGAVALTFGLLSAGGFGASVAGAAVGRFHPKTSVAVAKAVVVAKASSTEVTELHDFAVSAGNTKGLPPTLIPASARGVESTLRTETSTLAALHATKTSATGKLLTSLKGYLGLATRLAAWNSTAAKPLAASYFKRLRTTDTTWLSAMTSLGKTVHTNLLAGMAKLLFPTSA
jgi:hypothetical protein